MDNRISEAEVARILCLIANPPNLRDDPDQSFYLTHFDGGYYEIMTGMTVYKFTDGTRAIVGVMPHLSLSITFPDGRYVSINQKEKPRFNF
jgi:hypothetical protein